MRVRMRRVGVVVAIGAALLPVGAAAQHACDALGDKGWQTVATVETVARSDSKPFPGPAAGSWFIDRTTTVLPFCNYYNAVGNYSLRSYSLAPETRSERVEICRGGAPVAPYDGHCPPH